MADKEFIYTYGHISGFRCTDSAALGYRYRDDADFRSARVQSWLLYFKEPDPDTTDAHTAGKWDTFVSGIWLSASGRLYVALAVGEVVVYDGVQSLNEVHLEKVESSLTGIWGLDDQHVWAYGGSPVHGGFVHFFDGKVWTQLPRPPAWLLYMHGCAPDCVYGVGQDSVYRWDGRAWSETALRAASSLSCIWVESPDELYATDLGGVLFEGSADGWIRRAERNGELHGVAKFKDKVWIGGGDDGLLCLNGSTNQIEVIKANIPTRYFEAREQLMIPMPSTLIYSEDGARFRGFADDSFEELTENKPFDL